MIVSVIIPAKNRTSLLLEAIRSVAEQTYASIELILVDNASDERIEEVSRKIWESVRPVAMFKYIRLERGNGNLARNVGMKAASGSFIQFLDSDDLLEPRKLSEQVSIFAENESLDMSVCHEEFFKIVPGDWKLAWNVDWSDRNHSVLDRFCWKEVVWQTAGPLWRRRYFENGFEWDPNLTIWQDWDFHLRALLSGCKYKRLPHIRVFIRDHESGRSFDSHSIAERAHAQLNSVLSIADKFKLSEELDNRRRLFLEEIVWDSLRLSVRLSDEQRVILYRDALDVICRIVKNKKRLILIQILKTTRSFPSLMFLMCRFYQNNIPVWKHPSSTFKKIYLPRS